ncbi:hypothetical protein [Paucisalibacillus globulus]|uniref:hypothetical protein n=1 Tax=Paucisalibacillus globulus TaxID=351095 RepID=UPI001596D318|nr:hypothetical protein [Paucisalibacillus globulus]
MAKINWKTKEEIEAENNAPKPPSEMELLKQENEKLKADSEMNAIAIMELTQIVLGR